jgi:Holliday junction resolvase RusA-like endonuclease
MKQDVENEIMWQIKAQIGNPKILVPVKIRFIWIEKDYRRDLDNVCSAKKMIIDSMVKLQLIPNDNRKYVAMLEDVFPPVEKQTKVIVEIMEV